MRKFLLCVVALLMMSCTYSESVFHDENGSVVKLQNYQGKWVFINFWAAWCRPCIQEIPELSRFAAANKNVVVLGVNFDHLSADLVKINKEKLKMTFHSIIEDPSTAWGLDNVDVLPTTYILNPQGKVVKALVGPHSQADFQNTLAALQGNS